MSHKKIWIWNHYATDMFKNHGGRHYYFAKYLKEAGYDVTVFCASTIHNSNENIEIERLAKKSTVDGIKVVYIKARNYSGNGRDRIFNMIDFYNHIKKISRLVADKYGKPDVIYASSVHPLSLLAGIQTAKKMHIPCVCEVRDLWPESIVAYSDKWTRDNPLIRAFYQGEKWIYKHADHIIMTWPGGYDYIKDKKWDNEISRNKVTYISNGVDLASFSENKEKYMIEDEDLSRTEKKLFIYTGSIRRVNNLNLLVETAERLKVGGNNQALMLIYGDGDEKELLQKRVDKKRLDNIIFKGKVDKNTVPYILSKSYCTLLHNSSTELDKYGQSQNKFFEYLAAGRPILMTYSVGYSVIKNNGCGLELDDQTADSIAEVIDRLCDVSDADYKSYCCNAKKTAEQYDFRILTNKLIEVLDKVVSKKLKLKSDNKR